jgi:hypothetical protein
MKDMGGNFQTFAISVPVIQICTKLDRLLSKRTVPKRDQPHKLELTNQEGLTVIAVEPPSGPVPKVIIWEKRFFLRSSLDGRYRECPGHQAPSAAACERAPTKIAALRPGSQTAKMMKLLQRPAEPV